MRIYADHAILDPVIGRSIVVNHTEDKNFYEIEIPDVDVPGQDREKIERVLQIEKGMCHKRG